MNRFRKIEAGRYIYGQTQIVRRKPIPGRQQTTTWKDALTGEWLGYTLKEAKETVRRKDAQQQKAHELVSRYPSTWTKAGK